MNNLRRGSYGRPAKLSFNKSSDDSKGSPVPKYDTPLPQKLNQILEKEALDLFKYKEENTYTNES